MPEKTVAAARKILKKTKLRTLTVKCTAMNKLEMEVILWNNVKQIA